MKRIVCFTVIILFLYSSCGTENQNKDTSSEVTPDELMTVLEEYYSRVTYTGFDASTTWGTIAHEITEQEDIDIIRKSLQVSRWIPTDHEVKSEQVIKLEFYKPSGENKNVFYLYLDENNEYGKYKETFFSVPEGTYQHVVTLLQSYGHQTSDDNNEAFDLTQTLTLMLENPKLKIITDESNIAGPVDTEEYLNAFSVYEWDISNDSQLYQDEDTGSSIYFQSPNIHLFLTNYDTICIAVISTNLNESTYIISHDVFNQVKAVIEKLQ